MSELVTNRIRKVIADHMLIDIEKVVDSARLREDLNADSFDSLEIIMALEREFGISIEEDNFGKAPTVADVVEFMRRRLGANAEKPPPPSGRQQSEGGL